MTRKTITASDTLELCARAADMLRSAGFELRAISRASEASYFALPGRSGLLRVAAHERDSDRTASKNAPVIARLTLTGSHKDAPGTMRVSDAKFREMVARTIGFYMLRSAVSEPSK